jgi:hypothetical protein
LQVELGLSVLPLDPAYAVSRIMISAYFERLLSCAVQQLSVALSVASPLVAPLTGATLAVLDVVKSSVTACTQF